MLMCLERHKTKKMGVAEKSDFRVKRLGGGLYVGVGPTLTFALASHLVGLQFSQNVDAKTRLQERYESLR